MSIFSSRKSLSDLQEEDEYLDTEVSISEKKAMIRELNSRAGRGSWKMFSDTGRFRNINWGRIRNWLKSH